MEASNSPATGNQGLGKLVSRFKAVFRKASISRGAGESFEAAVAVPSTAPASEPEKVVQADRAKKESKADMQEPQATLIPGESGSVIQVDVFDGYDKDQQAFLAKYNLDIGRPIRPVWPAHNIPSPERVSKQIRMRVRYTCHRCNTSFGRDKECNSCRHRRCARCDRYPSRKTKAVPENQAPISAAVAGGQEAAPEESEPIPADLNCLCHECRTQIEMEVQECPNCHHTICERCHTESQLQSVDTQSAKILPIDGKDEREAQPEELKLPPDCSTVA